MIQRIREWCAWRKTLKILRPLEARGLVEIDGKEVHMTRKGIRQTQREMGIQTGMKPRGD